MKLWRVAAIVAAVAAAVTVIVVASRYDRSSAQKPPAAPPAKPVVLPVKPGSYLGVYEPRVPDSYAGVSAFTTATGVRPDLVVYYSGWREPFRASFAATAAKNGAVPLVQMEPDGASLAAIASGSYDSYLSSYAEAVRAYRRPVIVSFGHEMNGSWYPWGDRHTSPAVFVAAWRHIVTLFRTVGARNVTWLWTVNVISDVAGGKIAGPAPWWPGSSYVNWVGIDGYYFQSAWKFAPLFGSTVVAVRALTNDPILIAETAASPAVGQPEKITDLFTGVRTYGLLGFVWFNTVGSRNWRLSSPAAIAAFRRDAALYFRPGA